MRGWLFGLVAGAAAALGAAQEEAAARGRAVLAAAVARRGGAKAVAAVRDYVLEMEGEARTRAGGVVGVRTVRKVLFGATPCLLDRTVWRGEEREFLTETVLRGEAGRQRTPLGARRMAAAAVRRHWAGHHRSTWCLLRLVLEPSVPVRYLGRETFRGREVDVVEVRRPGEPPLRVDVERDTGFFLRVRWAERPRSGAPPRPCEIRYGGFRTVAGVKGIPFRAEAFVGGKWLTRRKTLRLEVNRGLRLEEFAVE